MQPETWLAAWTWMAGIAHRQRWPHEGPVVDPPATEAAVRGIEARSGMTIPAQLRTALTGFSARVRFEWSIPQDDLPHGRFQGQNHGGIGRCVWDIGWIEDALDGFAGTCEWLGGPEARDGEQPNTPEMWDHQFCFATLGNGDMLTIDTLHPDPVRQPVRYFSHELEGMHGCALAPNFAAFITAWSALGCVGGTHDAWFGFAPDTGDRRRYLSTETPEAQAWLAWLVSDHSLRDPEEPPRNQPGRSHADRVLLAAARQGSVEGATRALDDGANPDASTPDDPDEHATAITFAVRANDVDMLDLLLARGATLDTRRLPLVEAAAEGSPAMVDYLIGLGARVDGWRGDWVTPLQSAVRVRPARDKARNTGPTPPFIGSWDDPDAPLAWSQMAPPPETRTDAERARDGAAQMAVVDSLLRAGADPDARLQNRQTVLMGASAEIAGRLLTAGADPNLFDYNGKSALQHVRTSDQIRVLVQHGAAVDGLQMDLNDQQFTACTALQEFMGQADLRQALLDSGANPACRDQHGRSALWYCRSVEPLETALAWGLDPLERDQTGQSLLHGLVQWHTGVVGNVPDGMLAILVGQGVPVDAQDEQGFTVLHLLASFAKTYGYARPVDVQILLDLGVDPALPDAKGRRAADLLPPQAADLRMMLD